MIFINYVEFLGGNPTVDLPLFHLFYYLIFLNSDDFQFGALMTRGRTIFALKHIAIYIFK